MFRLILLAGAAVVGTLPANAQFTELVGRIPKSANTAIFLNAKKIFASPIAGKERWQQRRQAAFEAGLSVLPSDANEVVSAAKMDLEFGRTVWDVTLIRIPDGVSASDVAARFGGETEIIDDKPAAKLPNDIYVVEITDSVLASYTPSHRQDVARWLEQTDLSDPNKRYATYLQQAYRYATQVGTPLIMAVDLEHAFAPGQIKRKLPQLKSFGASGLDIDNTAELLAGIRGATLGVTFTNTVNGAIRVDLGESAEKLASLAKPMLIEVLENHGSMLEDIRAWEPSIDGNTFLLKGNLSSGGLRRVLSFLEMPAALSVALDRTRSQDDGSEESAMRVASKQYFDSVTALLDDLREKPKRDGVQTFGQAATWYSKYARKIDALPILNVDPALIAFGSQTAQLLRQGEMSMKGVGMRSVARTTGTNANADMGGYDYYGGYRSGYGYGYGYGTTPRGAVRAEQQADTVIRTRERVRGAASVQQLWQMIEQARAELRREMTEKYQVEF